MTPMRLGTRASPLALAQAEEARARLLAAGSAPIEIVPMTSTGDRVLDRPLAEIGGKGLFTKELDAALLEGAVDFAVHSGKDVETELAGGIVIAAFLPRADVRDRLIGAASLAALAVGARVGTSSPRRAAQLRAIRPDLVPVGLRGNVQTRLARLADGAADATLLAAAGLDRLGMDLGVPIEVEVMLPAPSQGAIAITTRAGEEHRVFAVDHRATARAVGAERALLAALGATCRSPVGALAVEDGGGLWLRAELIAEDGAERVRGERRGADGEALAAALAAELLAGASPGLRALFAVSPAS